MTDSIGKIDDSALLQHGANYDPRKAHEYYLRTRILKGKHAGTYEEGHGRQYHRQLQNLRKEPGPSDPPGSNNNVLRPSRREELLQQKAALEKRLGELKAALSKLVDAAKKRSGIETPTPAASTPASSKSAKTSSKASDSKPLTAAEKAAKAKADHERYQKEQGTSLAVEVQQLQEQVKEIRAKLDKALQEARDRAANSKPQTASNGR